MRGKSAGVAGAAEALWRNQNEKNWLALRRAIKAGGVRYYRVVFERDKLDRLEDLRKSFAELYDAGERPVAKVPIFMASGRRIEGATIYLAGLKVLNR